MSIDSTLFATTSDRLTKAEWMAAPSAESLVLVRPRELRFQLRNTEPGSAQVRTLFGVGGARYNLTLTDLYWQPFLRTLPPGLYSPGQVGMKGEDQLLLTVSLGEPTEFDKACYKLAAAVVELPPAATG